MEGTEYNRLWYDLHSPRRTGIKEQGNTRIQKQILSVSDSGINKFTEILYECSD